MPQLNLERFDEFLATIPDLLPEDAVDGADAYQFAQRLGISEQELQTLGVCDVTGQHSALNRAMLRKRCDSSQTDAELKGAILSIFAWGGMSHGHPLRIWQSEKAMPTLIEIIRSMRATGESLDPVAAFKMFRVARREGKLPYLGVSFYTKVLYFFFPGSPKVEAPILDQFSAKSINALFDDPPVPLWGAMPAAPANPDTAAAMYARYLECVDILRSGLKSRTGEQFSRSHVEWLLFRPGPGSWRTTSQNYPATNGTNKGEKRC
jgi:hypothetical protein